MDCIIDHFGISCENRAQKECNAIIPDAKFKFVYKDNCIIPNKKDISISISPVDFLFGFKDGEMILNCIKPYQDFLESTKGKINLDAIFPKKVDVPLEPVKTDKNESINIEGLIERFRIMAIDDNSAVQYPIMKCNLTEIKFKLGLVKDAIETQTVESSLKDIQLDLALPFNEDTPVNIQYKKEALAKHIPCLPFM